MASKYNANLLDSHGDDTEINLQFQEFEGSTTSNVDEGKSQTIYFNSFPDSAEDDQEQKLLGEEDGEPKKPAHTFWTFEYYQQFFDVESKQVCDRIIWSMVPKPGVNYLQSYIRPNPDLYGPFWICITLVFTTAIAGNLSDYLQSPSDFNKWKYDFHKVTLATSSIFSYSWLVPLVIWGVLLWRGSKANISLLEMICLYGYSLAIFVPVSLLWLIPLRWLQWCLGIVAAVLSGGVLVRTIQPAISHEARKVALAIAVLILVLHAALALGFMLYFFYPPTTTESPIKEVASPTGKAALVTPDSLSNGKEQVANAQLAAIVKNATDTGGSKLIEAKREERARSNQDPPNQNFEAEAKKSEAKEEEVIQTDKETVIKQENKRNDAVDSVKADATQIASHVMETTKLKLQSDNENEKIEINDKDPLKETNKNEISVDQKN